MIVVTAKDYDEMSMKAYEAMKKVLTEKPDATLGLATGSTPVGLYKLMIADYEAGKISYKDMTSINLDEYVGLPVTHPESYRAFMNRNLFDHIDIKKENTHVPDGLNPDLAAAADAYTAYIAAHPADVQILGIGSNGHIAFNEPGTPFDSHTHVVTLKEGTRHRQSPHPRGDDGIERHYEREIHNPVGKRFRESQCGKRNDKRTRVRKLPRLDPANAPQRPCGDRRSRGILSELTNIRYLGIHKNGAPQRAPFFTNADPDRAARDGAVQLQYSYSSVLSDFYAVARLNGI